MRRMPGSPPRAAAVGGDGLLARWVLAVAVGVGVAYQVLLGLVYFQARAGVIHRDEWRHVAQTAELTGWLERIFWSDSGHIFIYPFLVQEIGRALTGEAATFGVVVALLFSFLAFVVAVWAVAGYKWLTVAHRGVLILYLAGSWLVPMGMFPVWSFGTAAILTSTAPIAVLLFVARCSAKQRPSSSESGGWAGTVRIPWGLAAIALFGCALISIASGGGPAIFPALIGALFLLGAGWRTLLLFLLTFLGLLAAIKLTTGAPAGVAGTFQTESMLGLLGYPSGVLLNASRLREETFPLLWEAAYAIGAISICLSLFAAGIALNQRIRFGRAEPFLAAGLGIAAFGYGLGALISIGRLDFGLAWVIFPFRYGPLQLLIWTGLLVAYASLSSAPKAPAVRWTATGVWAGVTIALAALLTGATYQIARVTEYNVMGNVRLAALMVINGGADRRYLDMLNPRVDIRRVYEILKDRRIELAALPQAKLLGTHLDHVAVLKECEGRLYTSETLSDGTRMLQGVLRRPVVVRGIFADSVALVDTSGTIVGAGGFVSSLPYATRKTDLPAYAPAIVQDLYALDWILPRLLNQDIWFTGFLGPQVAAAPEALVYLEGSRPLCRLTVSERAVPESAAPRP